MLETVSSIGAVLALFVGISAGGPPAPADDNPAAPLSGTTGGAISTTPAVVRLIADGVERSPTFARIVSELLPSNVLVVVEPDIQMKCGLQGYMMFVTRTSIRRYLRIYFDPRLPRSQQIAIIGHELWHAVEIGLHPEVVDQPTLRGLYASIGRGHDDRWDSDAAVEAGHIIHEELLLVAADSDHR